MSEPTEREFGVPPLGQVSTSMLREALRRAVQDMRRAPLYALFFAGVYVAVGWLMLWISLATGQIYWMIFAVVSFPLIGPFAAVGLYEVSQRLQADQPLDRGQIFGVILKQGSGQLPSLCLVVLMIFLFWLFMVHNVFALFMGYTAMTNITTSYDVFLTGQGLTMLAAGSLVGAGFALVLYSITVVALPMLLDREVDFVSAMIASVSLVINNPVPMLLWALFIAVLTFVAMLPAFLGLFLVLPLLGHATWHLYALVKAEGAREEGLATA